MANIQLRRINQTITLGDNRAMQFDDKEWEEYVTPILFPLWHSDKDQLVTIVLRDDGEYTCSKRKYVRNHTTGKYFWKEYQYTEASAEDIEQLKVDIKEAYDALDSVTKDHLDGLFEKIIQKEKGLSLMRVRAWRDFFLMSSDWTMLEDAPITAEEKEQWKLYRSKIRELTDGFTAQNLVKSEVKLPIDPIIYKKRFLPYNEGVGYLETDEQWVLYGPKNEGGSLEAAMRNYMELAIKLAKPHPAFNYPNFAPSAIADPIDTMLRRLEEEKAELETLKKELD